MEVPTYRESTTCHGSWLVPRSHARADHVRGGHTSRSGSDSQAQQIKAAPYSPALQSHSTKIVPHITRPGTSCLRPATSERLPVKEMNSRTTALCTLAGTRAHTPEPSEQASIRAVWTPGDLMDYRQTACPTKRIASCPSQVTAAYASGKVVYQVPASPVCRTAPAHTLATANRAMIGSRGVYGSTSPGLRVYTMDTLKECEQADAVAVEDIVVAESDDRHQSPKLSSHPVSFHSSHGGNQTVHNPTEGAPISL